MDQQQNKHVHPLMPRSHIHGSPRRFHYGLNPTDDPRNYNFRSPIRMHNVSTTTYDYGWNTEIYRLTRIATDDAGSYLWLIPGQIRKCVTWALQRTEVETTGRNNTCTYFTGQIFALYFAIIKPWNVLDGVEASLLCMVSSPKL